MALPRVPRAALPACLLAAGWFLLLSPLARADHKPLTEDEQRRIDEAIKSGVAYLTKMQAASGDWPRKDKEHVVGYTALPALTLLECGVPASDKAIQKAARLVRKTINALEDTYDL